MLKRNNSYKQILIAVDTYTALKDLGRTGDSFNEVIKRLLHKASQEQGEQA